MNTNDSEWDKIEVEEMQELLAKINDFYEARDNPYHNINWVSNMIIKRLRNDRDNFVVSEGNRGEGKSNLLLLQALTQTKYAGLWKHEKRNKIGKVLPCIKPPKSPWKQIEVGFKFDRNISFLDDSDLLMKKFNQLDKYHPFVLDEGSKNLHKYLWNTEKAFKLVNASNTERYQNKSMSIAIPNFLELNSVFRSDRVSMRLFVFNRSTAKKCATCIVSLKDINRHIADPWHTDEAAKVYEHQLRRIPVTQRTAKNQLWAEKKLKNYACNFDIPSLKHIAPRIWAIYEKYKIMNAQKDINSSPEDKESKNTKKWKYATKMLMLHLKEKFPEINIKDFRKLTKISVTTLNKLNRDEDEVELAPKNPTP